MTIEEIKAIPIAAFLARMGYEPARRRGTNTGIWPRTGRNAPPRSR